MKVRIGHLLPELMNIYADRGNVECLLQRCRWRGFEAEIIPLFAGRAFDPEEVDIILIGGGQDRQQVLASQALKESTGSALRRCADDGVVVLAVCGGYQLMGHSYRDAGGTVLDGIGLLDIETVHPGPEVPRCIGNAAARWHEQTLVGFENHGGRTYLGAGQLPLAKVEYGHGNNSEDGTEGAQAGNVFGTYLHGSLLPKNPAFADFLLARALARRGCPDELEPLDDRREWAAHAAARALTGWSGGN
jgi:hypothetical protein